jgi:hypothetical protein
MIFIVAFVKALFLATVSLTRKLTTEKVVAMEFWWLDYKVASHGIDVARFC